MTRQYLISNDVIRRINAQSITEDVPSSFSADNARSFFEFDQNGVTYEFAKYRAREKNKIIKKLSWSDQNDIKGVFSGSAGNERNIRGGRRAFNNLSLLAKDAISIAWLKSCGLTEAEARQHVKAYTQLAVNGIDHLMDLENNPLFPFFISEGYNLNITDKIKTKYVAGANGTRLVKIFTPYVVDVMAPPSADPDSIPPSVFDFPSVTCVYKLNGDQPPRYILESASCDNPLLVEGYPKIFYDFIKNKVMREFESSGVLIDGVDTLIKTATALKVPLDLSGMNLSGLDLSQKNLSNAILLGVNLAGTKLPVDTSRVKVDRVTFLSKSKPPVPESPGDAKTKEFAAPEEIAEWKNAVEIQGGLHPSEMSRVVSFLTIHCNGSAVQRAGYTAGKTKSGSVSFGLFENDKAKIIHVESILHPTKYELVGDNDCRDFIGFTHFAMLIADIAKMKNGDGTSKKIDCIQMPLAVMEKGRQHYVQLQIYKTADNGIGARIIDSTANPIAIPVDFINGLLIENSVTLKAVLGATANAVTVSEVHTNEQLRLGDKKCGLYVTAGMKAAAEKVLTEGTQFLSSDVEAKNAVKHQHHLISKMKPMGCLMGMVTVSSSAQQNEAGSAASVSSKTDSVVAHANAIPSARAAVDGSNDDLSESWIDENDEHAYAAVQQHPQLAAISAYEHITNLLKTMDQARLLTAVEEALKSYADQNTGRFNLHFFRQFSSAGRDYAADAIAKIKAAPAGAAKQSVAQEIARQILLMGVKEDGQTIDVKHNSRVHHLLMALEREQTNTRDDISRESTSSLINPPKGIVFKDIGVMGCFFQASNLQLGSAKTNQIRSSRESNSSY